MRLRAGFYITPDAQYRIIRRINPISHKKTWETQAWDNNQRVYVSLKVFRQLKQARMFVSGLVIPPID